MFYKNIFFSQPYPNNKYSVVEIAEMEVWPKEECKK